MVYLTFVGSFPLKNSSENIRRATEDVLSIPVDYPNYIQLEDMSHQFLRPLAERGLGISLQGEAYRLSGELREPSEPVSNEALRILLELKDDPRFRGRISGVKACVTGPFTLSSKVLQGGEGGLFAGTMLSDPALVERMAEAVSKVAEGYWRMGAAYITVDEPILSIIVGKKILFKEYTDGKIVDIINRALRGVDCLKGIHVCGAVSRRLGEILLETDVDVLDHEFKDYERNFEVYGKADLESHGKKMGLGAVSSKTVNVEPVSEVKSTVKRGFEAFGEDNVLMIKPDCGFRGLDLEGTLEGAAYSASIQKIRNLRVALDSLR